MVPNMDVMRAAFEKWHAEHFLEPVTRSVGGSDYRNETVRKRWEGWLGACEVIAKMQAEELQNSDQ